MKRPVLLLCTMLAGCALYERNLAETTNRVTCLIDAIRMTPGIIDVSAEKLGPYYALIGYSYRDTGSVLQKNTLELMKNGDRYLGLYRPTVGDPFPLRSDGPSVERCSVPLGYPDQPLSFR